MPVRGFSEVLAVFDAARMVRIAMVRAARELSPGLVTSAVKHMWPADSARRLSIKARKDHIFYADYAGDVEDARNLEYGTASSPPRPAIHNYFENPVVQRRMEASVMSSLKEVTTEIDRIFGRI